MVTEELEALPDWSAWTHQQLFDYAMDRLLQYRLTRNHRHADAIETVLGRFFQLLDPVGASPIYQDAADYPIGQAILHRIQPPDVSDETAPVSGQSYVEGASPGEGTIV